MGRSQIKTRKEKRTITVFNDDIYLFGWMIIFGGELNEAIKTFANKIGVEPWTTDYVPWAQFSSYRPHKNGLIWFKSNKRLPELVAHEAFHGTMYVFNILNIKEIKEDHEELFAYYMQWLVKQILDIKQNV